MVRLESRWAEKRIEAQGDSRHATWPVFEGRRQIILPSPMTQMTVINLIFPTDT